MGRGGLKIGLSILIFCEESFGKHNKTTFLTKFREHPKQKHALNVFYRNQRELPPRHTQDVRGRRPQKGAPSRENIELATLPAVHQTEQLHPPYPLKDEPLKDRDSREG